MYLHPTLVEFPRLAIKKYFLFNFNIDCWLLFEDKGSRFTDTCRKIVATRQVI